MFLVGSIIDECDLAESAIKIPDRAFDQCIDESYQVTINGSDLLSSVDPFDLCSVIGITVQILLDSGGQLLFDVLDVLPRELPLDDTIPVMDSENGWIRI